MTFHEGTLPLRQVDIKLPILTICGYLGFKTSHALKYWLPTQGVENMTQAIWMGLQQDFFVTKDFIVSAKFVIILNGEEVRYNLDFKDFAADLTYHGTCFSSRSLAEESSKQMLILIIQACL